jgi:plastocyanin
MMKKARVTVAVSLGLVSLVAAATMAAGVRRVDVEDRCDPATFNAAIGPGTCVDHDRGRITFAEFAAQLNPQDFGDDHWRFNFGRGKIDAGETLQAANSGGEFHTFTEVQNFGGGCVDLLNGPLGLSPVPECAPITEVAPGQIVPTAFLTTGVDPGTTRDVTGLAPGTHKFQCLIHPWMRTEVTVR